MPCGAPQRVCSVFHLFFSQLLFDKGGQGRHWFVFGIRPEIPEPLPSSVCAPLAGCSSFDYLCLVGIGTDLHLLPCVFPWPSYRHLSLFRKLLLSSGNATPRGLLCVAAGLVLVCHSLYPISEVHKVDISWHWEHGLLCLMWSVI